MKKIFILFLGISLLSLNACSELVEDINVDPNNPIDAPIGNILNASLTGLIIGQEGEDARLGCMWAQQFTGSDRQYSGYEIYGVNAEVFEWDKFYLAANNANFVIEKAAASDNKLAEGIAKIVKAQALGTVTALWGDVPFSEALAFPVITDPKYDAQRDVYAGVQTLLDEAITALETSAPSGEIAATDFYFSGDVDSWVRVAKTLKARYFLHVGNYVDAAAIAGEGVYTNDQNWMVPHAGGAYNQDMNIYNSFGVEDRLGYLTANDSYLATLLDPTNPNYRGNSKTDESARYAALFVFDSMVSGYDLNYDGYWSATSSFPLVSAVENHLIEAESYVRENDIASAIGHLNAARTENAAKWGGMYEDYEEADFAAGGMMNNGGTVAESILAEVIEEKYISLVGEIEVYNDIRRTDNAIGITPRGGESMIPQRFLYPQTEIDANTSTPDPLPGLFLPTPVNQ